MEENFSRKLSRAELMTLVTVNCSQLEESRHWLEGALHSFIMLTDHRNLEYIRQAKRLHPRQA